MAMTPAECAWLPARNLNDHESRSRQQLSRDLVRAADAQTIFARTAALSGRAPGPGSQPGPACRSAGSLPHRARPAGPAPAAAATAPHRTRPAALSAAACASVPSREPDDQG